MRLLVAIIALLTVIGAQAQILDTTHSHNYKVLENYSLNSEGLHQLKEDSISIDTSLSTLGISYGAMREDFAFLDLGFEGSPLLKLAEQNSRELGLHLGLTSMDYYFFDFDIHRYHSDRPFTRLNYSQGPNELIYIDVNHGQEISKRLTFGVDYRRLKNQNFYYSNISNADRIRFANLFNTKFYTGYYNRDRSYEMLFGFLWNKNNNIETGGLTDPEFFELLAGRTKTNNNPVNLSDASSLLAEHGFKLTQFFRLNGNPLDTNNRYDLSRFKSQIVLNSALKYTRSEFTDQSPDSAYYGVRLSEIHDSISHRKFTNSIAFVLKGNKLTMSAAVRFNNDHIYQDSAYIAFNSLYSSIAVRSNLKQWNVNAKFEYGLSGFNQSDYHFNTSLGRKFKTSEVKVNWTESSLRQNYLQSQFNSSYLNWLDSSWQVEKNRTINALFKKSFKRSSVYLNAGLQQVKGLMYFNDSSVLQSNDLISVSQLSLGYTLDHKYWGTRVSFTHLTSSNQDVIPRPEFFGRAEMYVNIKLFKKLLRTQWGLSSRVMSEFNAPIYDPRIRQWRNSSESFEYYSPIQFFMRAKIKSFYFGFNVFHIQQGIMGEDYYSSPNYPMMPRAFRLNIQWDLAN